MPTPSDDETDDDSSSDDNSSSDSSSDSEEVTRDNVIDKVESYEGEKLDTDTYTFKEPEKQVMVNGDSHMTIKTVI